MSGSLNAIGDRINKRIKALGLTQKELALRCSLTTSNMNDIVRGRSDPGVKKLQNIAEQLDVDFVWLVYGKTTEQRADDIKAKYTVGKIKGHNRRKTDRVPGMTETISQLQRLNSQNLEIVSDILKIFVKKIEEDKN